MRGMQASRQQRTTAKADSAAEHRCLLRCFTRTIRAGEAPQQTAGVGVACPANARVRRSSQQSQEAGQCEEQEGTRRAAFLRYTPEKNSEKNAVAIATFDMRERKSTNKRKRKGEDACVACVWLCSYIVT